MECNRKLLSEPPMASSQSVQTLRNSRPSAGREGGKVPAGREAHHNEGGSQLWFFFVKDQRKTISNVFLRLNINIFRMNTRFIIPIDIVIKVRFSVKSIHMADNST